MLIGIFALRWKHIAMKMILYIMIVEFLFGVGCVVSLVESFAGSLGKLGDSVIWGINIFSK